MMILICFILQTIKTTLKQATIIKFHPSFNFRHSDMSEGHYCNNPNIWCYMEITMKEKYVIPQDMKVYMLKALF